MAKRFYGKDKGNMSEKNDLANMPQESFIKRYPEASNTLPETLDDSISGIDSQMKKDNPRSKGLLKSEKY